VPKELTKSDAIKYPIKARDIGKREL